MSNPLRAAVFALCALALLAGCRGSDGVTVLKVAHNGPAGQAWTTTTRPVF